MNFLMKNYSQRKLIRLFIRKKLVILIVCFSMHSFMYSQAFKDIDEVTPFHEDLAAIRKGTQWAFINREGDKIIDFRDDIVSSHTQSLNFYPMFVEGACLIKKMVDGVYHYGFIDKKGIIVIEPQYLNATNFTDGFSIIIKLDDSTLGSNALGKKLVSSKLEEYVIDTLGNTVKFLENSRGYLPKKAKTEKSPQIISKFIAPHLVAVPTTDGKWDVHKF